MDREWCHTHGRPAGLCEKCKMLSTERRCSGGFTVRRCPPNAERPTFTKEKCHVCKTANGEGGRGGQVVYMACGHRVCAECLDGKTGVWPIPSCRVCADLHSEGRWEEDVYQWA